MNLLQITFCIADMRVNIFEKGQSESLVEGMVECLEAVK